MGYYVYAFNCVLYTPYAMPYPIYMVISSYPLVHLHITTFSQAITTTTTTTSSPHQPSHPYLSPLTTTSANPNPN